jgi:hypothetical protein
MPASDSQALILSINADVRSLERQMRQVTQVVSTSLNTAERNAQAAVGRIQGHIGRIGGTAISGVTAQAGALGGALAGIGPAGIAAAAAIGAVAGAIGQAVRTAEWAEELGDVANALHLTTDQVQALDFAATAAGLPVENMRTTLAGLQQALGAAMGNDRMSGRMQRVFAELGIPVETLRSIHDVTQLLPLLADGFQRLEAVAPARAAALGQRLHIDPEVLHELEQGRNHIEELITAARRYGVVMDEDMVRRSGEAADAMRTAAAVMQAELRVAFAELTPMITGAATGFVQAVRSLNDFAAANRDALDPVMELVHAIAQIPRDVSIVLRMTNLLPSRENLNLAVRMAQGLGPTDIHTIARRSLLADHRADVNAQGAMLLNTVGMQTTAINMAGGGVPAYHPPTVDTPDHPRRASGGGARAARTRREATGGWDLVGPEGAQEWVFVWPAGTPGAPAHPMHFITRGGPGFEPLSADTSRSIDLSLPDTSSPVEQTIDASGVQDVAGNLARGLEAAHDRLQAQWASVIEGGLEAGFQDGWPGVLRYVLQTLERGLVQTLANNLAGLAAPNAAGGGGIGGGLLGSILNFGRSLFSPAKLTGIEDLGIVGAGGIGHNAGGTNNWRGGLTWVGEGGKELVNLPRGSQIIPAGLSRAMAQVAGAGGRGHTVVQPIFNDFRGAVMTEDLLRQANASAQRAAAQMGQGVLATAKRQAPGWVAQRQTEGR